MGSIEDRFAAIEKRLDGHDHDFARVEAAVGRLALQLQAQSLEHGQQITLLLNRFDELDSKLEARFSAFDRAAKAMVSYAAHVERDEIALARGGVK